MPVDLDVPVIRHLHATFEAAHRRFGDLQFDADAFVDHMELICSRCLDRTVFSANAFVETLHGVDVYLAFGCACGCAAAWQIFEDEYHAYIVRLAANAARTVDEAFDLAQAIVVDLFLPDRSGRSRIGSYDGRSSLATWLRVLVCHRAINDRKRRRQDSESLDAVGEAADEAAIGRLDATIRAHRYSDAAFGALRSAFAELSHRERLMLSLRYGKVQQVQEIAAMLCVHPSNVTRHIDRVCLRLRKTVIGSLARDYGLCSGAIEECLTDLVENPSYEVLSLLETPVESCAS